MTTEIQEYSQTESALSTLREQYGDVTYDVETTEGMNAAKAARLDIRCYRTALESKRKEIKAPALAQCKLIDSEAKRITAELRKIETPIDKQIKEVDARKEAQRQKKIDAETKRVEDIQSRIKSIREVVQSVTYMGNPTSKAVTIKIDDIQSIKIDDSFAEFADQAIQVIEESLAKLFEIHAAAVQREESEERLANERKELDAQRAEQDARVAEQRRLDKQAQDKLDADARKLADEKAEFERKQQEKADEERKAEESKQVEIEDARKRKANDEALAKRSKYPGDDQIIKVLADHFGVKAEVATSWMAQFRSAA